jgi:hypothetical protein
LCCSDLRLYEARGTTTQLLGHIPPSGAIASLQVGGQWTATVPSAPATGDKFVLSGRYEAAKEAR